jgi:hypothetical protein
MVSNVWLLQSAQWTNCFGGSCIFLIFSQLRKRSVSTIWLLQLAKRANRFQRLVRMCHSLFIW